MKTMERKNKLVKGASEESRIKFFKEIPNLEEKLTEIDSELFEATG